MEDAPAYATRVAARLFETIGASLPAIFAGLLVMVVFSIAAFLSSRLLRRISTRLGGPRRPLFELAGETLFYLVLSIGVIMGLGTMGVDVSALIAGLGLTGFALGFALRDAVSNLIAGVLILLYQPFKYGNRIQVAGNKGLVIGVNFRYTVLRSDEGSVVHVPNSIMFNNSVTVEPTGNDSAN